MNKYLMQSAAGVFAGFATSPAVANNSGVIDAGSGCTTAIAEVQKGVFAVRYGDGSTGQGLAGKDPSGSTGRRVDLSDNALGNYSSAALSFDISLPLKKGGTWGSWIEFAGTTSFLANSGSYTFCGGAAKRGAGVAAQTRALVEKLRAARREAAALPNAPGRPGTFNGVVYFDGSDCSISLYESEPGAFAAQYSQCGDGGGIPSGQGLARKSAFGKNVNLSYNGAGAPSSAIGFDLSYPFRNRGTWTQWVEMDGVTSFIAASGTYRLHPHARTGRGVITQTAALFERLRADRNR